MGIGYLHQMSIIHRDLKLENILLDQEGYLKIIDFGLAKLYDENKLAQTFAGTPEYLAPEMVKEEGQTVDIQIPSKNKKQEDTDAGEQPTE